MAGFIQAPLSELHAPYAPLLQTALHLVSPTAVHTALDLGCGPGLKTAWLAQHVHPGGQVLGIDRSIPQSAGDAHYAWIAADAHALPLARATLDLVWCVAAYTFFERPTAVLAEVRRTLRPQGSMIIASAYQLWVRPREWPPVVFEAWRAVPPPAGDGLGAALETALRNAGFGAATCSAYLLDPPMDDPLRAALPLAAWDDLAPQIATHLTPQERAACQAAEEAVEPEPRSVLLVAVGHC
ncbi:Methyltransferase type 11 [Oscillochloris trichoides DG-6]|uniref:Methyltransferase type 11 n=1 Tax=Oscillochloris trichoides DG-6 TaxID=765420 RepID=E1IAN4_9CHLR|nr:class I SAM-dependent methyltransferase [Oscillochloris trichoides]EFO81808.1 Methyltransferase type 11 [Oscillochloris trichoides DG-6]